MNPISAWVKFFLYKLTSSRYEIRGNCNSCGACCRNIVFLTGEDYVVNEAQFEQLKKFDRKYYHFEIEEKSMRKDKNGQNILLFRCKSLDNNNKCKDYYFRSIHCRLYPKITEKIRLGGFETFDTCGYKIVIDKKFEDYLK